MVERLWDWGFYQRPLHCGRSSAGNIAAAQTRLPAFARERRLELGDGGNGWALISAQDALPAHFGGPRPFDFPAREPGHSAWDVLLAHAFLDLIDLETALPRLLALLTGGLLLLHPQF